MTTILGPFTAYVWAAYGVSLTALTAMVLWALAAWRRAKRALKAVQDSATNL